MGGIASAIGSFLGRFLGPFLEVAFAVWDQVIAPLLEPILELFGIEGETAVEVQHLSTAVYGTNTDDVVKAGITRAVLSKVKTDTAFFPNYMEQIFKTKARVRSYYNYGKFGLYFAGLPDMRISGVVTDFDAVQAALDETFGSTHTVIETLAMFPDPLRWFKYSLQAAPDNYKPWLDTMTETDQYGVVRDDWSITSAVYNPGTLDYTVTITRQAEEAQFWIYGPGQITEGDTATFTIKSNRVVPAGKSIDINLSYTGTAVDGVDYTEVAQVTMLENTDEITVDILTAETANANRTFTITIASLDNTGGIFEHVTINAMNSVACTITDDDALQLTVNNVTVQEANTTITLNVKLEQVAPSGAFTVDYAFTDLGTTVGGVDYDNTTGTLNFAGTAGEVQTIDIDIYADIIDDDKEQFEVSFTNLVSSDSIDITAVSTVTILDGTGDPVPAVVPLVDTIIRPDYDETERGLYVTYSDDNAPLGEFRFWFYPFSDLTYDLTPKTTVLTDFDMMPMVILRKDKTTINVSPGTASTQYKQSRNIMMRIALEIEEFMSAINSNPDIDQVDDAYLYFGMATNDTNPIVSKLLYLSFFEIVVKSGLQSNSQGFTATIKEADIQNAIAWDGHTYTTSLAGVVTTEGNYIHSRSGKNLTIQYQRTDSLYDQLFITNVNGAATIQYDGYHEIALFNLTNDEMSIPLSHFIFNQLTAEEQMEVFQYVCRLNFNAITITELEWYETGAFADLFEFVLIVITIVSLGTASSFTAAALTLVEAYIVNYAIGEILIFLADLTGSPELAAAVAVIAAIALSDPSLFSSGQLLEAQQLINMATDFAGNLQYLENIEAMEVAQDIYEAAEESQEKLESELANRPNAKAVAVDSQFLTSIQSVDTSYFPAIQGQYEYNSLYNYDSLIANYHDTQLKTGVS